VHKDNGLNCMCNGNLIVPWYRVFLFLDVYMTVNPCLAGTFKLTLQFTEDYPNKPPTVRFVSRMFHPNSEYKTTLQFHFSVRNLE